MTLSHNQCPSQSRCINWQQRIAGVRLQNSILSREKDVAKANYQLISLAERELRSGRHFTQTQGIAKTVEPPRRDRPAGNLLMSRLSVLSAKSLHGDTNEHSLLNALEIHVDCQPLWPLG